MNHHRNVALFFALFIAIMASCECAGPIEADLFNDPRDDPNPDTRMMVTPTAP